MSILYERSRIKRIHLLVRLKQTGTATQLAQKLGVSKSTIYNILTDLKAIGAPIVYCREGRTFKYKYPVQFKCEFEKIVKKE